MRVRILLFLSILTLSAGARAQDVLFSDTFLGKEGQRPQMWEFDTPDMAFWTINNGWLTTGRGSDLIAAADKFSYGWVRLPGSEDWGDYRVSCRFWMKPTNGTVVLTGRWQDRKNHYDARIELYGKQRIAKIVKVFLGEEQVLANTSLDQSQWSFPSIVNGKPEEAIEFAFTLQGASLSITLDSNEVLSVRDEEMTQGTAGLGERMNEVFFDDFVVSAGKRVGPIAKVGTIYHIQLTSNISRSEAEVFEKSLLEKNLGPVYLHGPDDAIVLWQGNYEGEAEARAGIRQIRRDFPEAVVVSEKIGGGARRKRFTVQLYEGRDAVQAQTQATDLRNAGYVPEVVEKDAVYHVYVGRFDTSADAQSWQVFMIEDNFVLAKVVDLGVSEDEGPGGAAAPRRALDSGDLPVEIPKELLERPDMKRLTEAQRKEIVDIIQEAQKVKASQDSTTLKELRELKEKVAQLDEGQKNIYSTLAQQEQAREQTQRSIAQKISEINRAIQTKNWDDAIKLCDELDKIDPSSAIPDMKRERIKYLRQGLEFGGQEILIADALAKIERLKTEAARYERDEEYEIAREKWDQILNTAPAKEMTIQQEARNKIESLKRQIAARNELEKARLKREKLVFAMMLGGGIVVVLAVMLMAIYVIGRRRYQNLVAQLQSEAITPLQELRDRTQMLTSGLGSAGLSFDGPSRSLLEQSDLSDADFVIPEPQQDASGPPPAAGKSTSSVITEPPITKPASKAKPSAPPAPPKESELGEEDFVFPPGDTEPPSAPRKSGAVPSAGIPPEPTTDEIILSFDSVDSSQDATGQDEITAAAITATEVDRPSGLDAKDLVFSFEDTHESPPYAPAESKSPQPPPPPVERPTPAAAPVGSGLEGLDDSLLGTTPLDLPDMDFDIAFEGSSGEPLEVPANATAPLPVTEEIDLSLDIPTVQERSPAAAPEPPRPTAPPAQPALAGAAAFSQSFDDEQIGQIPIGWTGENTDYASLVVVPNPDGNQGNCLQFKKTAGKGATSFGCKFPDVKGKVEIEFDIRCDEKNKHLLGFYIEKDGDFRRSIHTVVQCVDPKRPAHLRVFTRPTPYTLKTWRHVRFVVDLQEGVVDGYVDNERVAGEIRMGMKAPSLNTLSIRDNTETTGVMYLDNLVVRGS
ncbi:SPOR domain-containing protein [Candidatus Sumerlaeota bacterium]|nr:SPOR domain-containing protein [Candidatus Sumerlaeota bacterium]